MTEKAQNTRQRLLDAAAAVFVERGYARATTKEIAKAADVAEGTIYRHFADKAELFQAVLSEQRVGSADALVELPKLAGTGTVRENLQRLIQLIEDAERHIAPLAASVSSDSELTSALAALGGKGTMSEMAASPLGPLAAYLEAEQKLGRVKPDIDTERAAFAIFSIPLATVTMARMEPGTGVVSADDIMGTLDVVLEGLEP
jgi:AcrR family transcriptional regulator